MNALQVLFLEERSHDQSLFAVTGYDSFLDFETTLSKALKTKIKILDAFANGMRSFRWEQRKRMEQLEHGILVRQKKAINRMRTISLGAAPNVSVSATPETRQPDFPSATSTSTVDLLVRKISRLCPQTAHSTSYPSVQYRESRVLRLPERRTRTVQVVELPRKAPLPILHDVAPSSDLHPPAESQTVFALDAIDDEIKLEPSQKKQRLELSSAKGTTNNLQ